MAAVKVEVEEEAVVEVEVVAVEVVVAEVVVAEVVVAEMVVMVEEEDHLVISPLRKLLPHLLHLLIMVKDW